MLLEARKHPLLERLYAGYGRQLLRRAFARVWVGGAAWPVSGAPVIAYANHSAWWDPVLAVFFTHHVVRRDGYGLMEGAQLLRFPFFRRLGCFGVTEGGGPGELAIGDARAVAAYAADLLRGGTGRVLWLFPQGAMLAARAPLHFRSGLARISRAVPEARLVPVAIRYEQRGAQRPECFVRLGEPALPLSPEFLGASGAPRAERTAPVGATAGARSFAVHLTRRAERELARVLDALDADLLTDPEEPPPGYTCVLDGRGSLSGTYDRTLGRLLRHDPDDARRGAS